MLWHRSNDEFWRADELTCLAMPLNHLAQLLENATKFICFRGSGCRIDQGQRREGEQRQYILKVLVELSEAIVEDSELKQGFMINSH